MLLFANVGDAMEIHPIEFWDHLVCNTLYPENLESILQDVKGSASMLEELRRGKEQVRRQLIRESLSCKTRQAIRILVEQYQVFFGNLLDIAGAYQINSENTPEAKNLYEQLTSHLETILNFLQTSFAASFNFNAKVPSYLLLKFEKDIQPRLSLLRNRLVGLEKNRHLIETFFSIIDQFLQRETATPICYHQVNYLESIVGYLSNWKQEGKDASIFAFTEYLISLKFNDERFVQEVLRTIRETISVLDEDEQVSTLKEYYRRISQILEARIDPLLPEMPSAKETILDWLSQEIHFFETRYPKKENATAASSAKINTSLSVPVLALYVRLFKEAGIITNNNYQELFRAVSSTFTTHRKADVAHSHLHSKFYSIEESAKRKVFDQLMEMAHLCKRIA